MTNKDPFLWLPDWQPPNSELLNQPLLEQEYLKSVTFQVLLLLKHFLLMKIFFKNILRFPSFLWSLIIKIYLKKKQGIYVPGIFHESGNSGSGNYFEDWEKPAHIEYFGADKKLAFSYYVGISVHGGTSPASPQKGLNIIARKEYGSNSINYPLFKNDPSNANKLEEFKRFILRSWEYNKRFII